MSNEFRADERRFMLRALRLAERGRGRTRPNPIVGAVVVQGGRIVGEGWHRAAGSDHAEIEALRAAGARARGATMVVTLEPSTIIASVRQALTRRRSTNTVHAPQAPVSHPFLVPVSPICSRKASSNVVPIGTSRS